MVQSHSSLLVQMLIVSDFIWIHIICWFGVPETITANNGQLFKSVTLYKLYVKHQIMENQSSGYHAPTNISAEFKKILFTILEKMIDKKKKTWPNKLPETLWAYCNKVRTPTQATPYLLVFGGEVVLPLEIHLLSLRVPYMKKWWTKKRPTYVS